MKALYRNVSCLTLLLCQVYFHELFLHGIWKIGPEILTLLSLNYLLLHCGKSCIGMIEYVNFIMPVKELFLWTLDFMYTYCLWLNEFVYRIYKRL